MSASLVGSEMCIRDRPGGARAPVHQRVAPAPSSRRARSSRLLEHARIPGAVSYTHLTLPTICSV
eukprot:12309681-Alexandrium_andersonii.AAC.1